MAVIINPGGRYVVLDNPKEVEYWLSQPGFRPTSKEEEQEYLRQRTQEILKNQSPQNATNGIYLSTVSVGGKDGYGVASDMITKELSELGITVKRYFEQQRVGILFHNPYGITRLETPYRIIYTMFESTKIPDDWHDYLEMANEVWVPSKWCQSVFAQSGIKTKVIPLGYNDRIFTYKERINKRKNRQTFTFLHYNAFNARKGFLELINAFTQEFEKDEPVKLLLKTTLNQSPLPLPKSQYPNIDIVYGKISDKELLEMLYASDCFVFPSRGEGFGMTPLEAMATGMSAIVPNAHGITEYFNPEYMYEVKVEEECPALYSKYKNQDVGKMFKCSVSDLRKQMRYVYEHQDECIEIGQKASEYVKQWTFKKTAEIIKKEFEDILLKPIPEVKINNILPLEMVK